MKETNPKRRIWRWLAKIIFFVCIMLAFGVVYFIGFMEGDTGRTFKVGNFSLIDTQNGKPSDVNLTLYWEAWNKLKENSVFKPTNTAMVQGSIAGLLSSVNDPYTVYFTAAENKQFEEDMGGTFSGIGIEIVSKNSLPTVVTPLDGSPALKAGIKAGDIITAVDGVKTDSLDINAVVDKIRGAKDTKVALTIVRQGSDQPLIFTVVRDTITVKSVSWQTVTKNDKKYMVVTVTQFGDDTDALFAQFAAEAAKAKPAGIIIDLRNNPGGYMETAIDMASDFVDGGTIVQEKDKDNKTKNYDVTNSPILKNIPTVVLVNGGSASASEIFSGALQDHKVAEIIGDKTFGKGCVQELIQLSDGSALKITVANWFTPNGRSITSEGITPDISIKNVDGSTTDAQLNRAYDYLSTGK